MFTALIAIVLAATPTPGPLVVVGGGATDAAIPRRALELAGGPNAKVLVIPQASTQSDGSASAATWRDLGVQDVTVLKVADPAAAKKAIARADLIWMPGGDQVLLMAALQKADLVGAIRDRHRQGATVGGTSAGAAVHSGVMITGEAPLNAIRWRATVTEEGLDLWPGVIVDQHFVKRQRFQRLLAAVLDRPQRVGVGIDEGTAAIVTGGKFTVMGAGQILVIDARKAAIVPGGKKDDLAAASGVTLHVLKAGMTFDLATEKSR